MILSHPEYEYIDCYYFLFENEDFTCGNYSCLDLSNENIFQGKFVQLIIFASINHTLTGTNYRRKFLKGMNIAKLIAIFDLFTLKVNEDQLLCTHLEHVDCIEWVWSVNQYQWLSSYLVTHHVPENPRFFCPSWRLSIY